jgi:hypothetical protein
VSPRCAADPIADEDRFRDEFKRLGADLSTAAVMAHRVAMATVDARDHLGGDDPVEAAATVERIADAAAAQLADEGTLSERFTNAAVDAAGKAAGTTAAAGAMAAGGWTIKEHGIRIAREFIIAIGGLYQLFHGG